MINIGIVGATGYTGVELLRLLVNHPEAKVQVITSRSESGVPVADIYPSLRGHCDLAFVAPDFDRLAECDLVFFATPHGVAHSMAKDLYDRGVKIIDLSADFRIKDAELWAQWYGQPHGCPELLPESVYGLPEINRSAIKEAKLIACPGCYPTATVLGLMPLLKHNVVDPGQLIANAASGISGAGRQAKVDHLLAEASDSVKAYALSGHRHIPEILQTIETIQPNGADKAKLTFIPHLLPMIRGMHVTLYSQLVDQKVNLQTLYEDFYANEPFVDVMPEGSAPQTRSVKTSNMCRLAVSRPQNGDTVVVLSVIDNLTKGAAGQAVQCMNILFGKDEVMGLGQVAIMP